MYSTACRAPWGLFKDIIWVRIQFKGFGAQGHVNASRKVVLAISLLFLHLAADGQVQMQPEIGR